VVAAVLAMKEEIQKEILYNIRDMIVYVKMDRNRGKVCISVVFV
jgi:hypothetical protein